MTPPGPGGRGSIHIKHDPSLIENTMTWSEK